MLIYILENNLPLTEVLYCDVGSWMWDSAKEHLLKIEQELNVKITVLDIEQKLKDDFKKYGFPSVINRWCTGIKRESMKQYLQRKYPHKHIIQYIGYCVDETKRTKKKLYSSYETVYPLVNAGITTEQAKKICFDKGFDFGGVYEHHSHFNCWLCPLQRKNELKYIYENDPVKWDILRSMQSKTDGYYNNKKTIFLFEQDFWEDKVNELKNERLNARKR